MDLQQMRYFIAVAEASSVTAAARSLHIAQPPLSRQLRQMEADLGVELFDRSGRRLRLTDAGRVLLERARAVVSLADRSLQEVRHTGNDYSGVLAIGAVASAASFLLPQIVTVYRSKFPQVRLQLSQGSSAELAELLSKGLIEAALVHEPYDEEFFQSCLVSEEKLLAVELPTKGNNSSEPLSIEDLAQRPLLVVRKYEKLLLEACARHACEANFYCRCHDSFPLLALATAGLGTAIIPASASKIAKLQGLCCREIADAALVTTVALIWVEKHYHSLPARQFIKCCRRLAPLATEL